MHACMYACMYVNAVSFGHDTPCSLSEVCWQETHYQMQPLNLELHIGEPEETHFCVKHAITDNREGLGPYKIK